MENEELGEQLKKGVEGLRKISMTESEKGLVLARIKKSISANKEPILSPWGFSFTFRKFSLAYVVVFSLIISLGGGVVFASTGSLPGSILYPLKVSFVEPIHSALIFSTEVRARYQSSLAVKRLIEAETLASKGELDSEKEEKLSTLLENHSQNLNNMIIKNRTNQSANEEINNEIIANFQTEMNARAEVLDSLVGLNTKPENTKQKEGQQEDKNKEQSEEKLLNNKGLKVSETARTNATKLKELIKTEDKESEQKPEAKKDGGRVLGENKETKEPKKLPDLFR